MSAMFYELIGRLWVRLTWRRFGRQIKAAGIAVAAAALVGGYLLARRDPPEG